MDSRPTFKVGDAVVRLGLRDTGARGKVISVIYDRREGYLYRVLWPGGSKMNERPSNIEHLAANLVAH